MSFSTVRKKKFKKKNFNPTIFSGWSVLCGVLEKGYLAKPGTLLENQYILMSTETIVMASNIT